MYMPGLEHMGRFQQSCRRWNTLLVNKLSHDWNKLEYPFLGITLYREIPVIAPM